jgi:hypothetical protein
MTANNLFVEQPWTSMSLLFRRRYRVEVFDERDMPVAIVSERKGPGLQTLPRLTGFSGWTTFDLVVVAPNGQPLLDIRKPFGRKPRITVTAANGQLLGWLRKEGARHQAVHDANGTRVCLLGDLLHINTGNRAKRGGRRVRRDVVQIRPGVAEPLRSLAVAGAVAFDVVRGAGTSHTDGDFDWSALGG